MGALEDVSKLPLRPAGARRVGPRHRPGSLSARTSNPPRPAVRRVVGAGPSVPLRPALPSGHSVAATEQRPGAPLWAGTTGTGPTGADRHAPAAREGGSSAPGSGSPRREPPAPRTRPPAGNAGPPARESSAEMSGPRPPARGSAPDLRPVTAPATGRARIPSAPPGRAVSRTSPRRDRPLKPRPHHLRGVPVSDVIRPGEPSPAAPRVHALLPAAAHSPERRRGQQPHGTGAPGPDRRLAGAGTGEPTETPTAPRTATPALPASGATLPSPPPSRAALPALPPSRTALHPPPPRPVLPPPPVPGSGPGAGSTVTPVAARRSPAPPGPGVRIDIGRIEIRTTERTGPRPAPGPRRSAPAAHSIDPRLPFSSRRAW